MFYSYYIFSKGDYVLCPYNHPWLCVCFTGNELDYYCVSSGLILSSVHCGSR